MYYLPPRFPRNVVLYTRCCKDMDPYWDPERQEAALRAWCGRNRFPVFRTVHAACGDEASVRMLEELIRTLPPEVDALCAQSVTVYTHSLADLGRLSLAFQCRRIWLYSLELTGPLSENLCTLTSDDYARADAWYEEILRGESGGAASDAQPQPEQKE